jgi:probable rRNA maturation factor
MPILLDTSTLTVTYTTKKVPSLDGAFLSRAKDTILKKKYELSLTCVGLKTMQEVNKKHRQINKPTDILSFPIDTSIGEIYLCFDMIEKKAKLFNISIQEYTEYVLVHGMIHLLGYDHGEKMDALEKKYTKRLHILYPYRYTV